MFLNIEGVKVMTSEPAPRIRKLSLMLFACSTYSPIGFVPDICIGSCASNSLTTCHQPIIAHLHSYLIFHYVDCAIQCLALFIWEKTISAGITVFEWDLKQLMLSFSSAR